MQSYMREPGVVATLSIGSRMAPQDPLAYLALNMCHLQTQKRTPKMRFSQKLVVIRSQCYTRGAAVGMAVSPIWGLEQKW